jgi:hypothetical protein
LVHRPSRFLNLLPAGPLLSGFPANGRKTASVGTFPITLNATSPSPPAQRALAVMARDRQGSDRRRVQFRVAFAVRRLAHPDPRGVDHVCACRIRDQGTTSATSAHIRLHAQDGVFVIRGGDLTHGSTKGLSRRLTATHRTRHFPFGFCRSGLTDLIICFSEASFSLSNRQIS